MSSTTDIFAIDKPEANATNNIPTMADAIDELEKLAMGLASFSVTSGNVTLTRNQYLCKVLVATGAPGAARDVLLPDDKTGVWLCLNLTTGGETITFKTVSGTGVTITASSATWVYSDGDNVDFAGSAVDTSAFLQKINNLSELDDISIARDNLGLGTAATMDAGSDLAELVDGKVPLSQLPDAIVGALQYQGLWNASTNTPTLSNGSAPLGNYYRVSTAGATELGGIDDWQAGDWLVGDGTAWGKIDNTEADHGHTAAGDGGVFVAPGFAVQVGDPATPAAGFLKLYCKEDGIGIPRIYAINEDGTVFDLTYFITSFLGLNDVPNDYTDKGGMLVRVKDTEDGVDFFPEKRNVAFNFYNGGYDIPEGIMRVLRMSACSVTNAYLHSLDPTDGTALNAAVDVKVYKNGTLNFTLSLSASSSDSDAPTLTFDDGDLLTVEIAANTGFKFGALTLVLEV